MKSAAFSVCSWFVLLQSAQATDGDITNCPRFVLDSGTYYPKYLFTTDPGVDYATWCWKHASCADPTLDPASTTYSKTYVKLPTFTVSGGGSYTWRYFHSNPISEDSGTMVATQLHGKKVAVPGTAFQQSHCTTAMTDATLEGNDPRNVCIGEDFLFQLQGYGFSQTTGAAIDDDTPNNRPFKAYSFVAFSNAISDSAQTSCDTADLQCCTIEIDIEGKLLALCVAFLSAFLPVRGELCDPAAVTTDFLTSESICLVFRRSRRPGTAVSAGWAHSVSFALQTALDCVRVM